MTAEMRKVLARLPYEEKLRRVAELIEFSRRFKAAGNVRAAGEADREIADGRFVADERPRRN